MRRTVIIAAAIVLSLPVSRCAESTGAADEPVIVPRENLIAIADVAACDSQGDESTAALVETMAGTIIMAGDIAYEMGTADEFTRCYDSSWGRLKSRTRPAPGNHEYATAGAAPYFSYFGASAGPAGRGYYSFDVGAWHIVSLDSNIDVTAGSEQERWLRADLAANTAKCTLAYWHHPLFSSGAHGGDVRMRALWTALYDANADVVIVGHDHHYERFAPQNALGAADATRGMRQFVVGTGGRSLYPAPFAVPNSDRRLFSDFGFLLMSLGAADYTWKFVPVTAGGASDSGTGTCH